MNIPQSLINITIPNRLVSWYRLFIQVANKSYSEEKENPEPIKN